MRQLLATVNYCGVLLLVVLLAMSSHPAVTGGSRSSGIENGTFLSPYIIMLFAGIVALSIKSLFRYKVQRCSWMLFFFSVLASLAAMVFFKNDEMLGDIRALGISLCAVAVGCNLDLRRGKNKFLLLFYALLFTFVGLMIIIHGLGGFVIEAIYVDTAKNTLGVNLAVTILIFVAFVLDSSVGKGWRLVFLAFTAFSFLIILTLRARSATLCATMIILYAFYVYNHGKNKRSAIFKTAIVFVLIIILLLLIPATQDYIFNSFTMGHEDDLLSGRSERHEDALDFFLNNMFTGNLDRHAKLEWTHNFPLLKLSEYGALFSLPIMLMYTYQLFFTIRRSLHIKRELLGYLGYIALLVPFVCSMAEPSLPYGPGTSSIFSFILFGVALRYDEENAIVCYCF